MTEILHFEMILFRSIQKEDIAKVKGINTWVYNWMENKMPDKEGFQRGVEDLGGIIENLNASFLLLLRLWCKLGFHKVGTQWRCMIE